MEGFENNRHDKIVSEMDMHKAASENLTSRIVDEGISDAQKDALRKMRDVHVDKLTDLQKELDMLSGNQATVIKMDTSKAEEDIELGKTG